MRMKIVWLFLVCLIVFVVLLNGCASTIPHKIDDRKECISCHGLTGIKPYPNSHDKPDRGNDTCTNCHDLDVKTVEMGLK